MKSSLEGQITFREIMYPELYEPFPCDDCIYDIIHCCNYPTLDYATDYCIMGNKQQKGGHENDENRMGDRMV